MKKILIAILTLALVFAFVGCSKQNDTTMDTSTEIDNTVVIEATEPEKSDSEILIERYRSGEWDGSETILNNTKYIVNDGRICEVDPNNGQLTGISIGFVDVPSGTEGRFLLYNRSNGTYLYKGGKITLYKDGHVATTFDSYLDANLDYGHTRCYDLNGGYFIIHKDNFLVIIQMYENTLKTKKTEVADSYDSGSDLVLFSDYDGNNWKISPNGEISENGGNYIKFPSETGMTDRNNKYARKAYEGLGRTFYVGGYISDGQYVDLYANDDYQTYTMVYLKLDDPDSVQLISDHVIDAEYETGRVIFYDGDAVYSFIVGSKRIEKMEDGPIKCLTETWTEDDIVQIIH